MKYEKAYKEALERARKSYLTLKKHQDWIASYHTIETIFPELKESEDEKIRKALTNWFKECHWDAIDDGKLKKEDIVAWLEKQGEQKLAWSEEDERMLAFCYTAISSSHVYYLEDKDAMVRWLKSLKEKLKGK